MVSLTGLPCYLAPPETGTGYVAGTRGGSERQVSLLANALQRRGHDVSVVVADYSGPARNARRVVDVRLIQAYDTGAGLPGLRFIYPRWAGLRRALAGADAEVYFQRGAAAVTGQTAHTCASLARPFVFGAASDTDTDPDRLRLGPRARRLYRYGLRRAAAVVAQHEEQQRAFHDAFDVDSEVIGSIVPSFPETVTEPADPPHVLWLGNIRAVKRPGMFLDLARRFPEVRFEMLGGPVAAEPEVFTRTRSEAAALANVDFHGPVADPASYLDRAWVLVNTSRVEGFPSSFLEAWAHGVPTLSVVDPGGVVEREGLGLRASSPEQLAALLSELLSSRDRRGDLGRRGREHVARKHRAESVAAAYERVFAKVAGHSSHEVTRP